MKHEGDYYFENGYVVFTEQYHLKRGYCCKNGCRHCPWSNDPKAKQQQTKEQK
jgi:2-iminoacetate synthase ThiH